MKKGLEKFNELVEAFEKLPGVGKKSALRYAYFVSIKDISAGLSLAHRIEDASRKLRRCSICNGLSENEICDICADDDRNSDLLCVVENPKDILVFEQNGIYDGLYFVLDDINEENILNLKKCIEKNSSKELIFAFTPSINSDALIMFLEDKLSNFNLKFTKIAQGIPTGVSLENVDMLSLLKAIEGRTSI
ncbi:recombination protein RecR [Campylobacter sp. RM12327]|uniref:recombination mediator RecR n=1 Tax=Campylobacter sputorum TaxID=206 RepID=UPI00053BECCD|nr:MULTISPECIES: recombination mediator RecR [Campylobacter]ASM38190.1 recombination protein [Campylobacter sputorum bv. paraureolyticus LMG 11764]ASM39816.1 recombination protein [Campylobacter sputorum]MBE7358613.1 recombination protein RecR [Campylobacter sp. RM11302]MBF6668793.1 recombination protein RecR [Campylobacter sp. RM12327]MBF6673707.1 recombination protein RecR [Campylobacter sp. RM13538]